MKQIKIQDILPLLKPGFVAMDKSGTWYWYVNKPVFRPPLEQWRVDRSAPNRPVIEVESLYAFNIAPFEDDWEDSLMECGK